MSTPVFTDALDDVDGTLLENHTTPDGNWTKLFAGELKFAGNELYVFDNNGVRYKYPKLPATAHQIVRGQYVVVGALPSTSIRLAARYDDTANDSYRVAFFPQASVVRIYRVKGGTETALNTATLALAVGDVVDVEMEVSDTDSITTHISVRVGLNGAALSEIVAADDTSSTNRITASGAFGLAAVSNSIASPTSGMHLKSVSGDDFSAGATPPSAPPSSVTASSTAAGSLTIVATDASTDETAFRFYLIPDLDGAPDAANKVQLTGDVPTSDGPGTGGTATATATGLQPGALYWPGASAVNDTGETDITVGAAAVAIHSAPIGGITSPAGDTLTLSEAVEVTFQAAITDPDGGAITYAWTKNGTPVGTNSGGYTTTPVDGDVIAVTGTDPDDDTRTDSVTVRIGAAASATTARTSRQLI